MKTLILVALLTCSCASASDAVRISAAVGRVICGLAGCPCNLTATPAQHAPIAYDVYPQGVVRPVYR